MILHLTITEHVCEAGAAVQVTEEGHRLRERYQNFENEGFSKFSIFPSPEEREYRERWSPSWLRGDGENRKSYIPLLEIALKSSLLSDSQESF